MCISSFLSFHCTSLSLLMRAFKDTLIAIWTKLFLYSYALVYLCRSHYVPIMHIKYIYTTPNISLTNIKLYLIYIHKNCIKNIKIDLYFTYNKIVVHKIYTKTLYNYVLLMFSLLYEIFVSGWRFSSKNNNKTFKKIRKKERRCRHFLSYCSPNTFFFIYVSVFIIFFFLPIIHLIQCKKTLTTTAKTEETRKPKCIASHTNKCKRNKKKKNIKSHFSKMYWKRYNQWYSNSAQT